MPIAAFGLRPPVCNSVTGYVRRRPSLRRHYTPYIHPEVIVSANILAVNRRPPRRLPGGRVGHGSVVPLSSAITPFPSASAPARNRPSSRRHRRPESCPHRDRLVRRCLIGRRGRFRGGVHDGAAGVDARFRVRRCRSRIGDRPRGHRRRRIHLFPSASRAAARRRRPPTTASAFRPRWAAGSPGEQVGERTPAPYMPAGVVSQRTECRVAGQLRSASSMPVATAM